MAFGPRSSPLVLVSAALLAAACSTRVDPSNPHDPATPAAQQARGKISGVVDPAVLPGGGETVKLTGAAEPSTTVVAASDGSFSFEQLAPDTYYLELQVSGFQTLIRPGVLVVAGASVDVGTLSPIALGSANGQLSGTLHFENGKPAAGATARIALHLGTADTFVADVPADATGAYAALVPPGNYVVTGVHPLYLSKSSPPQSVTAGQSTTVALLVLPLNPAALSGTVLAERAAGGGATQAAANATVTMDEGETTVVDAAGAFRVFPITGTVHTYRIQLPGWHDSNPQRSAALTPGIETKLADPIVLALDRGSLGGIVQTGDQQAIDGAVVELSGTSFQAPVVPDQPGAFKGSWRIDGVPVGSYTPVARAKGYFPTTGGQVNAAVSALTTVPTLTLAAAQGDFAISDGHTDHQPGFTRFNLVQLDLQFVGAASVRASEDATFGGGAQTFSPYPASGVVPFTLPAHEGTHTVFVQTRDVSNTPSGVFAASVVLDQTAPALPTLVIESGSGYTRSTPHFALTASATDAPAAGVDASSGLWKVRYSCDTAPNAAGNLPVPDGSNSVIEAPYARTLDFTLNSANAIVDGPKTCAAQFIDGAGNLSLAGSASGAQAQVVLLTQAPTVGTPGIANGPRVPATYLGPKVTDRAQVTLSLSATGELNAPLLMKLAPSAAGLSTAVLQPFAAQVAWSLDQPQLDGTKQVFAQFFDPAGNPSAQVSATVVLDQKPPLPTLSAQGLVNGRSATSTVVFAVSATDPAPGAGVASGLFGIALSESPTFAGATFGPVPTSTTLGLKLSAGDGPHTVYLRALDNAGNSADVSASVVLDTSVPAAALQAGDGSGTSASATVPLTLLGPPGNLASVLIVPDQGAVDCSAPAFAAAYAPWTPGAPLSTVLTPDGPHTVAVCLKNLAGTVSTAALTAAITVDTAPVTGAVAIRGQLRDGTASSSFTAASVVTLALTAFAGASGVESMQLSSVSSFLGAAWQPFVPGLSWALTGGDGGATVFARFRNRAGTQSAPASAGIFLDTRSPSISSFTVSSANPAGLVNAAAITLAVAATDPSPGSGLPASPLLVSEDPTFSGVAPIAISGSVPFTLSSAQGVHYLYAKVIDAAGNAAQASTAVVLDTQPPSAALVVGDGSGFSAARNVPLALTAASADLANVAIALDPAAPVDCTVASYALTWPGLLIAGFTGDGLHTLAVCLRDASGNVSPVALTGRVRVDSGPVSGTIAINGQLHDGSASSAVTATPVVQLALSASSTSTSIAAMEVSNASDFSGSAWQPYATSLLWQLAGPDGQSNNVVYARFQNQAGTVSATVSKAIALDTHAPAPIALSVQGSPALVNSTALTLVLSAADNLPLPAKPVLLSEDPNFAGAAPQALTATAPFTLGSAQGTHYLYARYTDGAGNFATASTSVVLNTLAPGAAALVVGDGSGFATSRTVPLGLVNPSAATANVAIVLDPPAAVDCSAASYAATWPSALSALFGSDGPHTVAVCLRDTAGNTSAAPLTGGVTVDTQTPTASVVINGRLADGSSSSTVTAAQVVTLTLSASAGASGVSAMQVSSSGSFSGAQWQPFVGALLWDLGAGDAAAKQVFVRVQTGAKVISAASAPAAIALDTHPPAFTSFAVSSASGGLVTAPAITLAVAANDPAPGSGLATTLQLSEDPSFAGAAAQTLAASMPFTLTAAQGQHVVYARLADKAGNLAQASATVVLDTVPPSAASLTLGNGSGYSTTASVALALAGVSADTASLAITSGLTASYTAPTCATASYTQAWPSSLTVNLAPDGGYSVGVCFKDAAGNVSPTPLVAQVTVDTATPVATLTITGSKKSGAASTSVTATSSVTLTIGATVGASGTDAMMVSNDTNFAGAVWQPFQPSLPWRLLGPDGVNTVFVKVRSRAQAQSVKVSQTITLDTAAPSPVTVAVSSAVGGYVAAQAITVTVTAVDPSPGSGLLAAPVELSEDPSFAGANATSTLTNIPFTLGAAQGTHTIFARFTDNAGNQTVTSTSVTLDTVAPAATVFAGDGSGYWSLAIVPLALTAASADIAKTKIVVDGGAVNCATNPAPWVTYPATLQTASLTNASHTIAVCLQDAAGNISATPPAATVLVDVPVPSGTVTINGALVGGATSTSITAGGLVTLNLNASSTVAADDVVSMAIANDNSSNLSTALFQPYQPGLSWQLSAGDSQAKQVWAKFKNRAGGTSAAVNGAIVLDTTPPSGISLAITNSNGLVNSTSSTVTVAGSDLNGVTVQVSEDPSFAAAPSRSIAATNATAFLLRNLQGAHTVFARFTDGAGNSAVTSATVTLDSVLPAALAVVAGDGSGTWPSRTVPLSLTSPSADLTSVAIVSGLTAGFVQPNCVTAAYTTPWPSSPSLNLLADGVYTVAVCLKDLAGNVTASPLTTTVAVNTGVTTGSISISGKLAGGSASATNTATAQVTLTLTALSALAADPNTEMQLTDGNNPSFAGVPWVPFQASTPWVLAAGDGNQTVTARFRTHANAQGSTTSASYAKNIVLDTTPPIWTQPPVAAATDVGTGRSVNVTYVATDNVDPQANLKVAFIPQLVAQAAPSCASATYGDTGAGTVPVSFASFGDGNYAIWSCVIDQTGNTALAPGAPPRVRLDTLLPLAPVLNAPTAQGSGVFLSWTDPNSPTSTDPDGAYDTDHFEIQSALDAAFTISATTSTTPSGNPPPLQFLVAGLEDYRTWYFRARTVEKSGGVSPFSAAVNTVAGVGERTFDNVTGNQIAVFADGPDLWAHWAVFNGVGSAWEAVRHCRAGVNNCHDSSRWKNVTVPYSLAQVLNSNGSAGGPFVPFVTPLPTASMFADDVNLWLVTTGTDIAGRNALLAYTCLRTTDCDSAQSWTGFTLLSTVPADAVQVTFSAPVGGVTGKYLAIAYGMQVNGTGPGSFGMITCPRSDINHCIASPGYGSWTELDGATLNGDASKSWCAYPNTSGFCPALPNFAPPGRTPMCPCSVTPSIQVSTGLQIDVSDPSFRPTMLANDEGVWIGARAAVGRNVGGDNEIDPGNPMLITCSGHPDTCTQMGACSGYGCGEVAFSNMSNNQGGGGVPGLPTDTDALPPVFTMATGKVLGAFISRMTISGVKEELVRSRMCLSRLGCGSALHYGLFDPPLQIFPPLPAVGSPYVGTPVRAQMSVVTQGHGAGGTTNFRFGYPDATAHKVWTASCTVAGCDASTDANWAQDLKYTLLASGAGSDTAMQAATVGRDAYFTGQSILGTAELRLPLVGTTFGMAAMPVPGGASVSWSAAEDSSSTNVYFGPSAGPPWTNQTRLSDPFATSLSVPTSASLNYSVSSASASGTGDQAQPWQVSPFKVALDTRVDLSPTLPVSIAQAGLMPGAFTDSNLWAVSTGDGATDNLYIGRCNTSSDCSQQGNWTWFLLNSSYYYAGASIQIDDQRKYTDALPIPIGQIAGDTHSYPRIMVMAKTAPPGPTQLLLFGCAMSATVSCTAAADWAAPARLDGVTPIDANANPSFRMTGSYLIETESTSNNLNMLVRYCDGSPANKANNQCIDNDGNGGAGGYNYAVERDPMYCLTAANWKTITLTDTNVGNGQVVAGLNPLWGWFVARGTGLSVNLRVCPFAGPNGSCVYPPYDCTVAANWSNSHIPASSPRALDLIASTPNYNPVALPGGPAMGMFLSYADAATGWRVAACRGTFDYNLTGYSCSTAGGWSSTLVTPKALGDALNSTIRVVPPNGDLDASFLETGRMALATCPGGMDCQRPSLWQSTTVAPGLANDAWVPAVAGAPAAMYSSGMLAPDSSGQLYLAFPVLNGATRTMRVVAQGRVSGP